MRDDNSPNLNVRQQSDLVDGDRTKYVMDWPYMIILRHDGLLHEIIEGRMRGKPTTGSRRIQMRHDLANDGGSVCCKKKIGLTTLQTRRARDNMIEVYKIMTGKDKIDKEQLFPLADSNYGPRGHSLKIRKDRSNLDIRKHFFSQRVVNAWNKLPQHVVDAPSVNSFKTGWTTSGKIWTLQTALLNKSIIVQVQVQVHVQIKRAADVNKNLCGRDGRTICGPQCVPKSTSVTLAVDEKTLPMATITARTDRQTDRQSATQYAAPS